jgi:hypothetical protein
MEKLNERVSVLEQQVDNLNKRLMLEEARWIPKTEVVLVWLSGKTLFDPVVLLGVFSTKATADEFVARKADQEKIEASRYKLEIVQMDTCRVAPVVQ